VPLSCKERRVARIAQRLRDGHFRQRQLAGVRRGL
jgi:hypothetical protein